MTIAAFVVSIVALIATIMKSLYDFYLQSDNKILTQLKSSLENAYNSLEIEKNGGSYPVQDRFQWLTASRHITRYTKLKKKLKTKLYKDICNESEEYWKARLYLLLEKIPGWGFYFWESPKCVPYEYIQPKSLAVIISFIKWGEEDQDPLDSIALQDLMKKNNLLSDSSSNYYFKEYMEGQFPSQLK